MTITKLALKRGGLYFRADQCKYNVIIGWIWRQTGLPSYNVTGFHHLKRYGAMFSRQKKNLKVIKQVDGE